MLYLLYGGRGCLFEIKRLSGIFAATVSEPEANERGSFQISRRLLSGFAITFSY